MTPTPRRPPKVPRPEPLATAPSPTIRALSADPGAVEAFWASARLPLVEDVGVPGRLLVTFCWRDREAEQVLLFANRITDETRLAETLLTRVPGTDLWHVGFLLEPDWRASYSFLVQSAGEPAPWLRDGDQVAVRAALDRGQRDPRNPDTCRNRAGVVQSVASLPRAAPQPWLAARPGVPTGRLTRASLDGRDLWLYDPPAADPSAPSAGGASDDVSLPVLLVLDGEVWTGPQSLPTTLDNLIADRAIVPVRALLVDSGGRDARWSELGETDRGRGSVALLVDELLPWLAQRRPVPTDPGRVVVIGQSLGGLTALRVGLQRPDTVGVVVSQSASLWLDDLTAEVAALTAGQGPLVHLAHGRQEWVLAGPHRALAEALGAAGVEVVATDYNGGHDYAWWRGAVADALTRVPGLRPPSDATGAPVR